MKNSKPRKFNIKMQKKLVVCYVVILLAFAGLCGRIIWIARENGTQYQKQVLSQQHYDSTTIPFRRGDIVDAKGTKLATSEKVYNVIIDASIMNYNEKYMEPTLQALGQCFPDLDMSKIREHVTKNPGSQWYVALRRLPYEEISAFQAMEAEDTNIQGVWFEEEYKRVYPNGTLASDIIGFTQSDNVGLYGLEEYYNDILNGTNGREYGYLNDDSALERTIKPAVDGYTIHSTIDANIQSIVVKYLEEFNEKYKDNVREGNGAENVGCIVMEVDTGNILAMASYPNFDLNNPRSTDALVGSFAVEEVINANGYTEIHKTDVVMNEEVLSTMTDEEIYLNLNNLWKNYCITNTYEPGSTAKPFTVAAALEDGAITANDSYVCNGSLEIGGHNIKCHNYKIGGCGAVNVQNSVAWSCNVALMKIGNALGKEDFGRFQEIFNFGLKTNVDLAGEARTNTLLYPVEDMKPADLATNTFGQNFNVTMIQMITGYCSLINGGYYYEPHMVSKITNSSGATVENIEPRVLKQVISEDTSALIRQYCRAVVMEEGGDRRTGKTARPAGYAIGGKTGTAQTLPRGNGEYVVSFIGHAPADDPKIAIYVVVDRANAAPQDDAKFATGIVRNVLTEVLPYLNIFMTEELSEKEIAELEERQLEITNKYTQTPEEDALEGNGNGDVTAGQDGDNSTGTSGGSANSGMTITDKTGESGPVTPAWLRFPIDPATGYRVNPATGEKFEADTGRPVSGNVDVIGADIPTNPNLSAGQLAE